MTYKLIVLEGLDCCGKTTVSKILSEKLLPSKNISFPDRKTEIGKIIDRFLKKEIKLTPIEAHLLYSANRYEKAEYIRETLKTSNIISDRYFLSGTVYSTAKGLDFDWCRSVDKELPIPDFTFFIDTPPEIAAKRGTFGSEAHDKIEFQKEVYRIYKEKSKEEKLIIIEGNQSAEKIAEEIMKYIESK